MSCVLCVRRAVCPCSYDECVSGLAPVLKSVGYTVGKDTIFMPLSGLTGKNLKTRLEKEVAPWWEYVTVRIMCELRHLCINASLTTKPIPFYRDVSQRSLPAGVPRQRQAPSTSQ